SGPGKLACTYGAGFFTYDVTEAGGGNVALPGRTWHTSTAYDDDIGLQTGFRLHLEAWRWLGVPETQGTRAKAKR
ncbi:MAG TPA: hypothetical protein DDZ88_26900, partial [Verrucomicrobiales bacterium]|nr:hypothetical protein [Verrucomicrobiales bacterium]